MAIAMTEDSGRETQLGFLRSAGKGRGSNVPVFRTVLTAAIPHCLQGGTAGPVMLLRDFECPPLGYPEETPPSGVSRRQTQC